MAIRLRLFVLGNRELKLLAKRAGIGQFEVEKEDKRWSMLEGGMDKNRDLDGTGDVKLSKSAQRKAAKEAKNKEAFRRFNPEADEEEEYEDAIQEMVRGFTECFEFELIVLVSLERDVGVYVCNVICTVFNALMAVYCERS